MSDPEKVNNEAPSAPEQPTSQPVSSEPQNAEAVPTAPESIQSMDTAPMIQDEPVSVPETAPAPMQSAPVESPAASSAPMNAASFVPGSNGPLPAELHGWNWGGFFLTWIWGVNHRTWISFLAFVPFVNLVIPFVLGAKGNEWAWQNRPFSGVEHFRAVQKAWTTWGIGVFVVSILFFFLTFGMLMAAFSSMGGSEIDALYNGVEY